MISPQGNRLSRIYDILGILGSAISICTALVFDEWSGFWFWTWALIGCGIGYLGAYGGLARKFGFQNPFTDDPLGWREAKKSYETNAEPSIRKNETPPNK